MIPTYREMYRDKYNQMYLDLESLKYELHECEQVWETKYSNEVLPKIKCIPGIIWVD